MKKVQIAPQQSVVGRAGGTVGAVMVAQSQGLGLAATVACGVGGYVLGAMLDGYLNLKPIVEIETA